MSDPDGNVVELKGPPAPVTAQYARAPRARAQSARGIATISDWPHAPPPMATTPAGPAMTTTEASSDADAASTDPDASPTRTGPAHPAAPPRRLVWILGLTETISWGTLFFAFTVFIDPMIRSLGWSKPFLAGGYSLGLLAWALCSFAVGRLLDRVPARKVMGAGSVLAGLGLLLWAWTPSQTVFLLMWVPIGLAMATTLYEPAFVVLRQAYGDQYQKPIVVVTLMAGFASTIFVPLAQWLVIHLAGARR